MNQETYKEKVLNHYKNKWCPIFNVLNWEQGQRDKIDSEFRVVEIQPFKERNMWTYATCCMSSMDDIYPIEIHIFSNVKDRTLVELLTAITHYHINDHKLNYGHTINFGKRISKFSECTHGLISLPYLDGQNLEFLTCNKNTIRFLWLLPITKKELLFKKEKGLEALEELFEQNTVHYLDFNRSSLV